MWSGTKNLIRNIAKKWKKGCFNRITDSKNMMPYKEANTFNFLGVKSTNWLEQNRQLSQHCP